MRTRKDTLASDSKSSRIAQTTHTKNPSGLTRINKETINAAKDLLPRRSSLSAKMNSSAKSGSVSVTEKSRKKAGCSRSKGTESSARGILRSRAVQKVCQAVASEISNVKIFAAGYPTCAGIE